MAPEARTEGEPFAFSGRAIPLDAPLPLFLRHLALARAYPPSVLWIGSDSDATAKE